MTLVTAIIMASCVSAQNPTPPKNEPVEKRALADDPHTLRLRIDHNMKAVMELLRRKDVTRSREVQDEIIADFDRLLQKMQPPEANPDAPNPPPPVGPPPTNDPIPDERLEPADGQSPSGGSRTTSAAKSNKPQPGGGSAGHEKNPSENQPGAAPQPGGTRRERRGQKAQPQSQDQKTDQAKAQPGRNAPNQQSGENRPGPRPGDADGSPGANPDQARGATMSPSTGGPPERFSDLSRDVWGHLPETMRQEVDHYYRDRFMPRYRQLLQQYYSRLAETDRKDKK